MTWRTVSTDFTLIENFADLLEDLSAILGPLDNVYDGLAKVQGFLAKGYDLEDPLRSAVVTALRELAALLEDNPLSSTVNTAMLPLPLVGTGWRAYQPPGFGLSEIGDIALSGAVRLPSPNLDGSGGNYGFYRTALEALFDERDPSRPQLDPDAYTGLIVLLYGAEGFAQAFSAARSFELLTGELSHGRLTGVELPVPQDLKVRPTNYAPAQKRDNAPVVDIGDGGAGTAYVKWAQQPTAIASRAFKGVTWRVLEARVYVKRDSRIRHGEDLSGYLVHTQEVPERDLGLYGLTLQDKYDTVYLTGLNAYTDYYVSVAFVYEVDDGKATTRVEPDVSELSTQARANLTDMPAPTNFSRGTPPDWVSFNDAFAFVPGANAVLERAGRAISRQADNLDNLSGQYDAVFELLSSRINIAIGTIESLLSRLRQQISLVARISGGVWFGSRAGRGGSVWYVRELADLLLNEGLDERPAFDDGDEVVGGFVLLAQGPAPESIETWLAGWERLFGGADTPASRAIMDLDNPSMTTRVVNPFPGQSSAGDSAPSNDAVSLGLAEDDPCVGENT